MERGPSQVWELRIGAGRVSSSKQRQQPKSPRVGACMARTACYSVPPTTLLPTFIVGGRAAHPPTHQQLHASWLVRQARELPGISDISTCNGVICPAGSGWLASGVERLGLWVWVFEQAPWSRALLYTLRAAAHPPLLPAGCLRPHRPAIKVALLGKRGLGLGGWL